MKQTPNISDQIGSGNLAMQIFLKLTNILIWGLFVQRNGHESEYRKSILTDKENILWSYLINF